MKKWLFVISVAVLILVGANLVNAQEKAEIYFFYSPVCPHCAEEKEFLAELEERYPEIEIRQYEVISSRENQKLLEQFYQQYEVPKNNMGRVPVTFTPAEYFVGFNQQIGESIERCLKECLAGEETAVAQEIKIPFFGKVNVSQMSLPVLTITLGAVDGLNPCAMWILLLLIALLINTRSRKRMWLIGGTFIAASGIVYYLILTAWLNLFLTISYVNLTRIAIGVFALGVGIWQIKNFIGYKGVCPVTNGNAKFGDKIRNGLRGRAEKLVLSPFNLGILLGIVVLAIGINMIEFFCSAGIPAIYTRILSLNALSTFSYYSYLLLYAFLFMLDDLIIFSLAVITLTRVGFTDKYNYWATLFGGILIFALGALLIFKPEFLMFG